MRTITMKKFIALLDKEEGEALRCSLKLSPSRMTTLILRRLEWVYNCLTLINKKRIKNMGTVRFFEELKQGFSLWDSNEPITIKELINSLRCSIAEIEIFIDKHRGSYRIGMYITRTLLAYKLLLIRTHEEHERKVRYYGSN